MAVVTIARQLGAGGSEVAQILARRLGWRLFDQELVERIAVEMQVLPEVVGLFDERVETVWERAGQYLGEGATGILQVQEPPALSPTRTARAAMRVIERVSREGAAVIVGRGAQCVLRGRPNSFHVLLHAPLPFRAQSVRGRFGGELSEIEHRLSKSDRERGRYIRAHFDQEWMDARLYDLCLDTSRMEVRRSADLIYSACRALLR